MTTSEDYDEGSQAVMIRLGDTLALQNEGYIDADEADQDAQLIPIQGKGGIAILNRPKDEKVIKFLNG